MGIFDIFKDKSKDTSDAVEEEVNEKTGGKFADQVDAVQEKAEGAVAIDDDKPDE
ncbi:Rv0909 family putative TA system antitoxin [Streptomyces olivoreticuli]|uniref:Rv0909 family putative TA system antitoxin n=1 Tax=Streptomyces olivoreticuli TaxID=68246 RepID=UPI000E24CD02|nr:Rv0909 family putative TA system antitoxin [Streptomyces olivoreticuli]